MTPSLTSGKFLPDSYEDFKTLLERRAPGLQVVCAECRQPFTEANVKTHAGWRETQISDLCEVCFDTLLDEGDDNAQV
jgi:hypothetical protein